MRKIEIKVTGFPYGETIEMVKMLESQNKVELSSLDYSTSPSYEGCSVNFTMNVNQSLPELVKFLDFSDKVERNGIEAEKAGMRALLSCAGLIRSNVPETVQRSIWSTANPPLFNLKKPEIEIPSRSVWIHRRIKALDEAINTRIANNESIPEEWITERNDFLKSTNEAAKVSKGQG